VLGDIFQRAYDLRRKIFGSYVIQNPQQTAASAPYTYYLPPQDFLDALAAGDIVKIIIQSIPPSRKYDSERMWVIVTERDGEAFTGVLDNQPFDIPQLTPGDLIPFSRQDIIDIDWDEDALEERSLKAEKKREYWERCKVESVILDAGIPVQYVYREGPDPTKVGGKHPDSGWRIQGNVDLMTQEQYDSPHSVYIAIGKVLNADDSWLHLIDFPVGSRFMKDNKTDEFLPYTED
jgi:hypothetical protein